MNNEIKELEETLERTYKAYENMCLSPYGIHESIENVMINKIGRIKNEIETLKLTKK